MHHRCNGTRPKERLDGCWIRTMVCVFAFGAISAPVEFGQQNTASPQLAHQTSTPEANRLADADGQMQAGEGHSSQPANSERERQIAEDNARLLDLATELKHEIDKSSKDTLSLSVIHKAEDIEKLARKVQQKMKLTMATR